MTYIKLEDVQAILDKYTFYSGILREEINSLPSIDPKEMIREMVRDEYQNGTLKENIGYNQALQELLNKLPK